MKTLPFAMPAGISVYLAMLSLHLLQVQVSKTGKKLPIQAEGMLHIVDLASQECHVSMERTPNCREKPGLSNGTIK